MLRFRHKMLPRKIKVYPEGGPEARLKKLRQIVTGLIRYERVEPTYSQADEARQFAERIIHMAIKNGDKHGPTMEMLDYWLLEKDLIHKLFKVLVPRFEKVNSSYTNLHKLAIDYPGKGYARGVLELKGNPWPSIKPAERDTKYILSNLLLSAAKHNYHAERQRSAGGKTGSHADASDPSPSSSSSPSQASSSAPSAQSTFSSLEDNEPSSSVDPPKSIS